MKIFEQSGSTEEVKFSVDGDEFTAIPPRSLPANALIRYAETVAAGKLFEAHERFFADVLTVEGYDLFYKRLDSGEVPININTMISIASWLVGDVYGGNPTDPAKP